MIRWHHALGGVGVIVLVLFFVWGGSGVPSSSLGASVGDMVASPSRADEYHTLSFRVEELKNIIAQYELGVMSSDTKGIDAKVFSLYPFNTKQRIYIDKGSVEGVVKGDGVVISNTLLVGEVSEVFSHTSEVITLFDSRFSLPVRIGEDEVDALFEGGVSPRLSLIDKSKTIHQNDLIFTADRSLPYGLSVGYIGAISEDSSGAFLTSSVSIPYNLNDLRDVLVLPSHER